MKTLNELKAMSKEELQVIKSKVQELEQGKDESNKKR